MEGNAFGLKCILAQTLCVMCCVFADHVGLNEPRAKLLPAQGGGSFWRKEIPEEVPSIMIHKTSVIVPSCLLTFSSYVFTLLFLFIFLQNNGSRRDNLSLASLVPDEGIH